MKLIKRQQDDLTAYSASRLGNPSHGLFNLSTMVATGLSVRHHGSRTYFLDSSFLIKIMEQVYQ